MKKALIFAAIVLSLSSCKFIGRLTDSASELFGDEVVARVGRHRLHRSELAAYIPAGVSPDDSAGLARQYINAWAQDLLFQEMADRQLSKSQKDVSRELEEYRRSLLRFRYEQLYINERLDTLISAEEVSEYYRNNQEKFALDRPLFKSRYIIIPADSRAWRTIRAKMTSDDDADLVEADSLAFTTAIKYVDASDNWMDAILLAREFGTDYESLLAARRGKEIEMPDEQGNLRYAYIVEMVPAGAPAPIEYCENRIRDIILSGRKHDLMQSLEQDLLQDALDNDKLVIY